MTRTHRREGAFDRVGRPQVSPVLSGEVLERQQLLAILGQGGGGFEVHATQRSGAIASSLGDGGSVLYGPGIGPA